MVERALKVLIVAENASTRFGGEAILPWHYFRVLRRRGVDVRMIVHSRTRSELLALLPNEADRLYFLPDTALNKIAWRLGRLLPAKIGDITLGFVSRLSTQLAARTLARHLVAEHRIGIVHQPIPVSPREPSLLHGLGAPVVIGPMNGNMSYPPGFEKLAADRLVAGIVRAGRLGSAVLNRLMPGKLLAAALLVANRRTREALPAAAQGEVIELVENGVDLATWTVPTRSARSEEPLRLLFMGRLVDWKGVDMLIEALAQVRTRLPARLEVLGDGPMRASLEAQVRRLGLEEEVTFAGWRSQQECAERLRSADVLVLPSLYECGGAVVLEAMSCGVPVVATDWGGPAEYLDASCGILVSVQSRRALVDGLVSALRRLADPGLRAALGQAGRERARRCFDWEVKVDRMLEVYGRFGSRTHGPTT